MAYAMLTFGRAKVERYVVTAGDTSRVVSAAELETVKRELTARDEAERMAEHEATVADAARRRAEWLAKVSLEENVSEVVRLNSRETETTTYDVLTIDGARQIYPAGTARSALEAKLAKRFPDVPPPVAGVPVVVTNADPNRTWVGRLVQEGTTTTLVVPENLDWAFGLPAEWIVSELGRLEAEGWALVSTSEDHGLYTGADAPNEAFVTRARYLLHR